MLPCCAPFCLAEVRWRPSEWSGQVWPVDWRPAGCRLCSPAKLKDKDKGIKTLGWRIGDRLSMAGQTPDSFFFLFKFVRCWMDRGHIVKTHTQNIEWVFCLLKAFGRPRGRMCLLFSPSCIVWISKSIWSVPRMDGWMNGWSSSVSPRCPKREAVWVEDAGVNLLMHRAEWSIVSQDSDKAVQCLLSSFCYL